MNKSNLPKISVAIPVLNNESILVGFFKRIVNQNYPKEKIELIVADGGSKDRSTEIARKYGAKIFSNRKVLAEPGVSLAISKASGEIIMILAVDNFLDDPESLSKTAKAFSNKNVFAAFPRHESSPTDSIYTKYINTFTDPFNHFVYGYAANGRTFKKVYNVLESNEIYDVYNFTSSRDIPLIAFAQGFAVRSSYVRKTKDSMDDIKPVMDIINEGKKIAFIHSVSLFHHTVNSLAHFIRKQRWATRNVLEKKEYGISYRSFKLSSSQRFRMKIWPLYAVSFVIPMVFSFFHLIKDREVMWLAHAPLCFVSATASVYEVLVYNMFHKEIVSRQT